MKEKRTGRSSVNEGSNWKRLRSQSDSRIPARIERDPDARPTDADFWKKARVVMPTAKKTVTIRLDGPVGMAAKPKRVIKRESMRCSGPTWRTHWTGKGQN